MPTKMERFTLSARTVLRTAEDEARQLEHALVAPEHLLLGLVREEFGVAGRTLRDLVDEERVAILVKTLSVVPHQTPDRGPQLSPRTQQALELAVEEARRLGDNYVAAEHLLLGLLRQADSTVFQVLEALNVSLDQVQRRADLLHQKAAKSSDKGRQHVRLKTPLVDQIFDDVTAAAKDGMFDRLWDGTKSYCG